MIKARIDKFNRDDQATQHVGDGAMRLDVGTEFVAAEKRIAAKERIAFAFEKKITRQPGHFVTVLFHPFREKRRFAGAFFVAKIARDKFLSDRESGVRGENHVGQLWLRRHQMNRGIQFQKRLVQTFPLLLGDSASAPRARLIHGLISYSMP